MKKSLVLLIILGFIFGMSCVFARNNTNTQNKTNGEVGYLKEDQPKENTVNNDEDKIKQEKRDSIQSMIQAKQKEIINAQNSRNSMRSIDAKVNQLRLEIKDLQKELNSIK